MKFRVLRSTFVAAAAALITGGIAITQPIPTSAIAPLAAAIDCTTSLEPFPGNGFGTCNGTATGIANGAPAVLQSFTSSFDYTEPCPPTTGTAAGNYASGTASGTFTWERWGLTLIVVLHPARGTVGVAAGLLLPSGVPAGFTVASVTPPFTCSPPWVLNATMVAVGAGI